MELDPTQANRGTPTGAASQPHVQFELSEITPGDLVRVVGRTEEGEIQKWDAEVTGTLRPNTVEVYFIEESYPGISTFRHTHDEVDIQTLELHVPVDADNLKSIAEGWKHLGYIPLDEHDFWMHGKEIYAEYSFPHLGEHYINILRELYADSDLDTSAIFDADSEESEYEDELNSSASQDEPFCRAEETSEFVRETHAAVRAMSERYCISDNKRQKSVRDFLNHLHYKYEQ